MSKHTICAGPVSNPGACQRRVVKMMNGCHISKALGDLGSYWQAHHSQHVSQLITSNFIFLVNTSWQIGHYLFILRQWALLLFWWCLEVFLLLSASSHPEWNEELWERQLKRNSQEKVKRNKSREDWQTEPNGNFQLLWLKAELVFWVKSWFLGFSVFKSSDSVYYVDEVGKQKLHKLASSDLATLNSPHLIG